jgi:hypothetical protein
MRRVSPTGTVSVLNLEWSVPHPQPDRGVWVTIEFTRAGAWLSIYDAAPDADDRTCLATYPFPLKEAVQPRPVSQPTPDQERIPSDQAAARLTPGNLILSHWRLLPPANLTSLPQALPHLMARAIRSTLKATAHFISTMF